MTFEKQNAAEQGFNLWTINGTPFPMINKTAPASFHLKEGKRYRIIRTIEKDPYDTPDGDNGNTK